MERRSFFVAACVVMVLGTQHWQSRLQNVMLWVSEGDDPAVVRIVGQLGGYGPVVNSDLEATSFGK